MKLTSKTKFQLENFKSSQETTQKSEVWPKDKTTIASHAIVGQQTNGFPLLATLSTAHITCACRLRMRGLDFRLPVRIFYFVMAESTISIEYSHIYDSLAKGI